MYCVYILFSEKLNKFYIGMTSNFDERLEFNLNDVQKRKFTHNAEDWALIYKIETETKELSLSIEKHIKSMKSKIYIQNLIQYPEISQKLIEKYRNF